MTHGDPALEPWSIDARDFPASAPLAQRLRFALGFAVLAPSGHNAQPWRFRLLPDGVELLTDPTRTLPVVDPRDRGLVIGCGAALFHLGLALRCLGHATAIDPLPPGPPDLLARLRVTGQTEASVGERRLLAAIPRRHTNRLPFATRSPSQHLLETLVEDAALDQSWLRVVTAPEARRHLADLVAEGDLDQMADPSFRRELATWLHPNHSHSRDGMRGYSFGHGDLASMAGPLLVRAFDLGEEQALRDRALAESAPALLVLGRDGDERLDWLCTGLALARVLLRLTAAGLAAAFLNQPVEVARLRPRLAASVGRPRAWPQLLLRVGFATGEVRPTPRRPVDEVLVG